MDKGDERRKRFFPSVSLGSILASVAFIGSGIGIYTQVIADVNSSKIEIANLKANEAKKEAADKDSRTEIKQDIRDVKTDVKELRGDIQKVLQEVMRNNRK